MSIDRKKVILIFLSIFLAELISLSGYLLPQFRQIAFLAIALLAMVLAYKDLKYGIWFLLVELFIGSKGYLFYFEQGGLIISIRIAFWLIVMSVWLGAVIGRLLKTKKLDFGYLKVSFKYFIILFLFIGWGLINGFLNKNEFGNIFFDFNGWLYLLLLFPLADYIYNNKTAVQAIGNLFLASVVWLIFKTFFLLFVFSHNLIGMVYELYRWTRESGVGEITLIEGGFYRIFFQSQIFILIAVFILLFYLSSRPLDKKFLKSKEFGTIFALLVLLNGLILITFSRSFWLGTAAGLLAYGLIDLFINKIKWRKFFLVNSIFFIALFLSAVVIIIVVKFPYPAPTGGFSTASLFADRATNLNEAAVSSRWQLLPELSAAIKKAPILGQGFGTTVTYNTNDLRILESSADGRYTTYAFEWGWLDIWLKLGLFGLLVYLGLVARVVYSSFLPAKSWLAQSIGAGLIVIVVVSIFSPYLNHPLGIGFLLLAAAISALKPAPA